MSPLNCEDSLPINEFMKILMDRFPNMPIGIMHEHDLYKCTMEAKSIKLHEIYASLLTHGFVGARFRFKELESEAITYTEYDQFTNAGHSLKQIPEQSRTEVEQIMRSHVIDQVSVASIDYDHAELSFQFTLEEIDQIQQAIDLCVVRHNGCYKCGRVQEGKINFINRLDRMKLDEHSRLQDRKREFMKDISSQKIES